MSDNNPTPPCSDGKADAIAAICLVAIAMTTVIYWLASQ